MVEHGEAGAPCGGPGLACQRAPPAGVPVAHRFARALQISTVPGRPNSGAGEGNRTLVVSLEGFCSTIELHPLAAPAHAIWGLTPSTGRGPDRRPLTQWDPMP